MSSFYPTLSWIFLSIFGLELIVSFILNVSLLRLIKVVLGGRLRHPKLRHFLVSLMLVNLLLTVVALPVWIYLLLYNVLKDATKLTENLSAILYYSFDIFYGMLVLLHIVVLMMERLYAIGWPIQHRIAADLPDYLTCGAMWFMAALCSIVAVVVLLYYNFKELALVVTCLCFPIPLVISLGLFFTTLIKKKKTYSNEIRKKDFKLAMVVAFVELCCITLCAPLHVFNALYYTCSSCNIPYFVTIMSLRCLQYSCPIVIDVIFLFGIDEFRCRVAWCYFRCCSINEHSENDLLHMDIPGATYSNTSNSQCTLTRASTSANQGHVEHIELGFTNNQNI